MVKFKACGRMVLSGKLSIEELMEWYVGNYYACILALVSASVSNIFISYR